MRQVILDTETTGLDPSLGHRIIELAAIEVVNRRPTGRRFHRYLNPERESDGAALEVHGLRSDFLLDKPKFKEIAREFLEFISDSELIIHNAAFDLAFLDYELRLTDSSPVTHYCHTVTDTLRLAKDLHPGKKNGLDALCERYEIDHSTRTLHGALLDAELLSEVYLAMTRGQESLIMELEATPASLLDIETNFELPELVIIFAGPDELAFHEAQLEDITRESHGACLWRSLGVETRSNRDSTQPSF